MERQECLAQNLSDPEKTESTASLDIDDRDEALKVVGLERAETFTEEQYRKVRWKLVRRRCRTNAHTSINWLLPCPGFGYNSPLPGGVLFAISVRMRLQCTVPHEHKLMGSH